MSTRALHALARRIRMAIGRGVVRLVNDTLMVQGLQVTVLDGETANVQRFQEYGYTSVPLSGAEAILASIAGVRSHLVAIAVDDGRYRLKNLHSGEVALYTDEGDSIVLKRGRIIAVTAGAELDVSAPMVNVAATTKVTLDTPEVHCTHKLTVAEEITCDSLTATTEVSANGITLTSRAAA
ncbi:phage baseplate assembly protein V [Dyella lutea]|uniref:Phage baseplate assembly protein V n=1 Tax=Dyella lutea TaxID=2950441 RepID=A0ABT1FDE3_9GAMM|nr:phage baseplate assembly protein V [Dyella lutea]MCP1375398.1 phage baseplate assembly protein V [Dyella lutea]